MYEIWVRNFKLELYFLDITLIRLQPTVLQFPWNSRLFSPQEDDVDGEHIIAFAEESDPGEGILNEV